MKKAICLLITVCLLFCMIAPAVSENERVEYVTIPSADEADFLSCVQRYIDEYDQCSKDTLCWTEKEWPVLDDVIHYPYVCVEMPFFNMISTYHSYLFSNGHVYYLRVNGSVEEIICADIVNSTILRGNDCSVFSLENTEKEDTAVISPQVGEKLSLYLEQETVLSSTEYLTMSILKQEKQVWVLCHDGCSVTDFVVFDLQDRSMIKSTLPMRIFSENYLHLTSRSELLTLFGESDCDLGSGVERLCYVFVDGSYIIYDIQGENIYRVIHRSVFD